MKKLLIFLPISVVAMTAGVVRGADAVNKKVAAEGYDLKALVTPMTFSCELRDVRLTRIISGMSTGKFFVSKGSELSTDKSTDSSGTRSFAESTTDESSLNHSEKGSRNETKFNVGGAIRVSGGAKWGAIPFVGITASGKVGGKYSKTSTGESRQSIDQTSANKRGTSTTDSKVTERITTKVQDTISENTDESRLGGYELVFSVILRNMDTTDRLKVDGANMRARLSSDELPGTITAKYKERGEFELPPNDEALCEFKYPVEYEDMLKSLLILGRDGRLGQLKLSQSGADIVVTSEKTGRNVLFDLNKAKNRSLWTRFSVEFGDLMTLPDWRVSRRHSVKSGPRGKRVSIHEALLAIQSMALEKSEVLPTNIFTFADDGSLIRVDDRPLLDKDSEGHYMMFALRLTKNNGATELCLPNAEIMKAEIGNYAKVALFSFNLEEFVEVLFKNPEYFSKLKTEVEKHLACCVEKEASNVYKELLAKRIYEEDVRPLPEDMSTITAADVKRYKERAKAGIPEMQYKFAFCLYTGKGIEENYVEAAKWFHEAAKKGHKDAQYRLGCCYLRGEGRPRDGTQAEYWLLMAAEQGHEKAQYELGYCYKEGYVIEKDEIKAAGWFRKAAENGNADAQVMLGHCYLIGEGVVQNLCKAEKLFRKAAAQGNTMAQNALDEISDLNKKRDVGLMPRLAEVGDIDAQFDLAWRYAFGDALSTDLKHDRNEVVKRFRTAAELGNVNAQCMLGGFYAGGIGVEQNISEAVKWIRKAAEQGSAEAQFTLGQFHLTGRGIAKNEAEAAMWFRKAAKQGHALAQEKLRSNGIEY